MKENTPLYNLKAVSKESGLSPATLRAWERRYGLIKPLRSAGGHRLYSRQDIEMLKWLVERQNEGLSISHAVELWNYRKEETLGVAPQPRTATPIASGGETLLSELRQKWLEACMEFDDLAANHILDQAFAMTAPELVCTEILQKGLAQVGEGWYRGQVSVQQEHFTSAVTVRRLNALMTGTTPAEHHQHILAACPPGEEHDFVLLLISYLLRRGGWDVVYLGSNVPLHALDSTIQATSPVLVISTAQMLTSAAALREMSELAVSQGVAFAFGGGIFTRTPTLSERISGYYLAGEIRDVPRMVERLITNPEPVPQTKPVSSQYRQTLAKFQQNQLVIANFVASMTGEDSIQPDHLQIANDQFSRQVAAALSLGEITYLNQSTGWLAGLLDNYGVSKTFARQYFVTYRLAVDHYLAKDGEVIHGWLTEQINAWQPDRV